MKQEIFFGELNWIRDIGKIIQDLIDKGYFIDSIITSDINLKDIK